MVWQLKIIGLLLTWPTDQPRHATSTSLARSNPIRPRSRSFDADATIHVCAALQVRITFDGLSRRQMFRQASSCSSSVDALALPTLSFYHPHASGERGRSPLLSRRKQRFLWRNARPLTRFRRWRIVIQRLGGDHLIRDFRLRAGEWCNGNTSDSESLIQGSNPCSPTLLMPISAMNCMPPTVYTRRRTATLGKQARLQPEALQLVVDG